MTLPPPRPWDQAADGLLTQVDLPAGWHLAARFPGERADDASDEIDRVLGYDDQATGGGNAASEQNETAEGRWRYIEHEATATRVMIRLQRQLYATPEEVRITGVIYLPWRPGDPITSHLLRELPTAKIEAAINKRLFAMKRVTTVTGNKIILPSGRKISDRELLKPLGNPKQVPDFYESSHSSTASSPARATKIRQRRWHKSTASPSALHRVGSQRPVVVGCSRRDAAVALGSMGGVELFRWPSRAGTNRRFGDHGRLRVAPCVSASTTGARSCGQERAPGVREWSCGNPIAFRPGRPPGLGRGAARTARPRPPGT
ncbi:hypothetical protein [Georgenia yuyongxinii]